MKQNITALPFGLSTAASIFTKLSTLVRVWHQQGSRIFVFLDDGCGTAKKFQEALCNSNTVKKNTFKRMWFCYQ